jgi:hypothetical protein
MSSPHVAAAGTSIQPQVNTDPICSVRATVRTAATDAERAATIETWLQQHADAECGRRLIVAEGFLFDRSGPQGVPIVGLAAGCPCCTGSLALRVALARAMRRFRPHSVLLLVASSEHLGSLRRMLAEGELGVRFEIED